MRFLAPVTAAAMMALQVASGLAQTPPPPPVAPTPAPPAAAQPMPAAPPEAMSPATKHIHPPHLTLAQRFAMANTTHDGRLTREQADAARWKYISRNFDAIDQGHRGYVTVDDIHAYARAHRSTRTHRPKTPAPGTAPGTAPAAPPPEAPPPSGSTSD